MAELTYRDAVIRGIAQEMSRDPDVVFLGEDVAKAGGVFKATVGLYEQFGPLRVRDTPISEQAILGAAMGAAMTGLKPIAEIMFSDFFAVCFDYIANEFPKSRYMSNGQVKCPLVVRTGNGAGSRFGAQHSQSVENWCMMIPGLKVVAPSSPRDVIGLLAASVRDPDPVIFLEHKSLYPTKGEVPDGEIVDTLGTAKILRSGKDATICALALMVPRALEAAEKLKAALIAKLSTCGLWCRSTRRPYLVRSPGRTGCLRSRKTHDCVAGVRKLFRSWRMKPSTILMARPSELRHHIFHCRRPISLKTSSCRRATGLLKPSGGACRVSRRRRRTPAASPGMASRPR
jgi:pyruvate/2-oxoglutarate/acetoin dehydrogenase E1 component